MEKKKILILCNPAYGPSPLMDRLMSLNSRCENLGIELVKAEEAAAACGEGVEQVLTMLEELAAPDDIDRSIRLAVSTLQDYTKVTEKDVPYKGRIPYPQKYKRNRFS